MLNPEDFQKPNWTTAAFVAVWLPALVILTVGFAHAQTGLPAATIQLSSVTENPQSTASTGQSQRITFSDALQRARANSPETQAAFTALGLAHEDFVQSRAALLPNVNYNMAAIYTDPTSRGSKDQIFIANNGVHEYISQGNLHQNLSLQTFADYGRAAAAQAVARAKSEIALRGLAVTVARAFYGFLAVSA